MFKKLRRVVWAVRYKRAVREARKMSGVFGMTYFVIMLNGRLKVVPKATLKALVRRGRFKRGTTIQDIEKRALYIAR